MEETGLEVPTDVNEGQLSLTEIVQAPLGTEANLTFQVVRIVGPGLQREQPVTDTGFGDSQLIFTCLCKLFQCDKCKKHDCGVGL